MTLCSHVITYFAGPSSLFQSSRERGRKQNRTTCSLSLESVMMATSQHICKCLTTALPSLSHLQTLTFHFFFGLSQVSIFYTLSIIFAANQWILPVEIQTFTIFLQPLCFQLSFLAALENLVPVTDPYFCLCIPSYVINIFSLTVLNWEQKRDCQDRREKKGGRQIIWNRY